MPTTTEAREPDLDKLYELAQAATPGPWSWAGSSYINAVSMTNPENATVVCEMASVDDQEARNDAAYIAAADPTTILALIDRCQRAETALREIRTAAAWRDDLDPKERLRMCLVAARAALEGGSK